MIFDNQFLIKHTVDIVDSMFSTLYHWRECLVFEIFVLR